MSGGGDHGGGGGHKRRGGHDEEHEEHENHERWLVSYADMMTLLMVLFIVLFAISQVDAKKFMALKTGLSAGFGSPVAMMPGADGMLDVGGAVAPDSVNLSGSAGGPKQPEIATTSVNPDAVAQLAKATEKAKVAKEVAKLQEAEKKIKAALAKAGMKNAASYRFDERGLVVTIATDKVLFSSGDATLTPAGRKILATIAPTLEGLPNRLSVDGHTNSIPISTARFPSNWELSTDRATGVLRYLATTGIPADRMYATGFADTKPLLPPSNPASLVKNRRVEIVVLASLDNSAGRAVAELGNKTAAPSGSDTAASTDAAAQEGSETATQEGEESTAEQSAEPTEGATAHSAG